MGFKYTLYILFLFPIFSSYCQYNDNGVNLYNEILNPHSVFFKEINRKDVYRIINENKTDSLKIRDSLLTFITKDGEKIQGKVDIVILNFKLKQDPNYTFEFVIEQDKVVKITMFLNDKKYGYQHHYFKDRKGQISRSIGYYDNYLSGFYIEYSAKRKNFIRKLEYRVMGTMMFKDVFYKNRRKIKKSYIYQENVLLFCYSFSRKGRLTNMVQYSESGQEVYSYSNRYGFKISPVSR